MHVWERTWCLTWFCCWIRGLKCKQPLHYRKGKVQNHWSPSNMVSQLRWGHLGLASPPAGTRKLTAQPPGCVAGQPSVPVDLCRIRTGRQRGRTHVITVAPLKHLSFGISAWTLNFFAYAGYSLQCFWTLVLCSLRENAYLDSFKCIK